MINSKYLKFYLIFLLVTAIGCNSNNPSEMIPAITGYWQIETVTLSNGTSKNYSFSETIDYIEVADSLSGFRKKLKPRLNGTYITSKNLERFELKVENDSLNIYYTTPFDNWKETVLRANENQLIIMNKNNDIYSYKPYEPISLE